MKRILVTLLGLLSIIALIQFSPNTIIPVSAPGPSITSNTLTAPANGAALTSTYIALTGKVVTSPATVVKDVQVYLKFVGNATRLCSGAQNVTATGTFSCNYSVEKAGLYTWQAIAEGKVGGTNMTGVTSSSFTFTATPIIYLIRVVAGWNLVSLPIVPASTAIANVLASQAAGANLTIVWSYQGGSWKSAMLTATHTFTGSLTTMQDGLGYWIYMTKADNLTVVGSIFPLPPATPPSYPLSAGWNLIGFKPEPTILSENVTFYLQSLGTKYDNNSVWTYSNSLGTWYRYACDYAPVGLPTCAKELTPGEGLWVYMTAAGTLYP